MAVNSVKKINFQKINVNDYSLSAIQSNVQQSFNNLTSIIGSWNDNLFYAQPSIKTPNPIAQNATYIFDTVLQDKYYTYDKLTGKYRCPTDGLYFINVGIYSTFNSATSWDYVISLYINGSINTLLSYNNNIPSGNNYMSACYKMLLLNSGDILEIKNEGTNNVLWKTDIGNNIFSYFQVWFIC